MNIPPKNQNMTLRRHNLRKCKNPGGALHILRVRGCAIGKGIYFPDIDINCHNFGIRNGTYFQDFYMKYIRSDIPFRKIGIRSGIRPKSGQVHPPGQEPRRYVVSH